MEVAAFFLGKYKQGSLICRGGTPWPPLVALAWRELQNRSKQKIKHRAGFRKKTIPSTVNVNGREN